MSILNTTRDSILNYIYSKAIYRVLPSVSIASLHKGMRVCKTFRMINFYKSFQQEEQKKMKHRPPAGVLVDGYFKTKLRPYYEYYYNPVFCRKVFTVDTTSYF